MLNHWLKPVPPNIMASENDAPLGTLLQIYTAEKLPNLRETQVAIIGIGETDANEVRRYLYQMSAPFYNLAVADLGNVRKSNPTFVIPLFKEILESQIIPVIISADTSPLVALYKALQAFQSHISLTVVDERIRLNEHRKTEETWYLNPLLLTPRHKPYYLSIIGCQTHYTTPEVFQFFERHTYDCLRLGSARADLTETEPLLRDGDLAALHLAALRQADAPGQLVPTPAGFTVEEACQLCRYAGMSDKLRAYGIFGFRQEWDQQGQTAQAVAQMVWYFLEGVSQRKNDFPVSTDGLTEYIVDFKHLDYQLTFWKSQRSNRWWMQVPVKLGKKYHRHRLIPCSYNDYKLACQDELPDRLLNAYKRFL